VRLTADPVTVQLGGKEIAIQSIFTFVEGEGKLLTQRNVLTDLEGEPITFEEYFTGAFGTTEYQADMSRLTLGIDDCAIPYAYHGDAVEQQANRWAYVIIPDIMTTVEMGGDNDVATVSDGIAFSPVYQIKLTKTIKKGGITTWLKLEKAN
jgi:hypothetical protein